MSASEHSLEPVAAHTPEISGTLTAVIAIACGTMVANLYYAQPLIGIISPALGLHDSLSGFVVTLAQIGYAAGLAFIASLADLIENRRLILWCVAGTAAGLIGTALATSAAAFFTSMFVVGLCSVGAQVLVPFASFLASPQRRGRVIGNVMGGLIAGIMLARPVASLVAASYGWRAIFALSAVLAIAAFALLSYALPTRRPQAGMSYGAILRSSARLLVTLPALRRRAIYQSTLFAIFNLFWTAIPLVLAHSFGFDQRGIALFALVGASGALAAPIAGRLADRNFIRSSTAVAMIVTFVALLASGWAVVASALVGLVIAGVALDAAVQANQIIGQRVIFGLSTEARGRINASYMTCVFIGGSTGSALAGVTLLYGGWWATVGTGAALSLAVLAYSATEPRSASAERGGAFGNGDRA